jgi:cytochrome P450
MSAETAIPDDIANNVVAPSSYLDEELIHDNFTWLRKNNPLGVTNLPGYDPFRLVTKHKDITAIERNPGLYSSGDENPILNDQASDQFLRNMNNGSIRSLASLTFMDPPEHTKFRNITSKWFMANNMYKLESLIGGIADDAVEKFLSFDGECDFVKDFALYYPLRVIMGLFGVPPEDEPMMLSLTQDFFGFNDPDEMRDDVTPSPEAAAAQWQATLQDFFAYFNKLTEARRKEPRDDLLSLIANAKVDGEYIGEAEANGYYVAIATAGHDTTSSTSAGGLLGLIQNPDQFKKLQENPDMVSSFVEEALRWASPVRHFMRMATEDTELNGSAIKKGERLMLCYPSANRDEEVFDQPFKFDISRKPNRHIAFGVGPHMCLGQALAKLEIKLLFDRLLPHLKSIELAGEPKYMATNFVGGLKSLPIRFTLK